MADSGKKRRKGRDRMQRLRETEPRTGNREGEKQLLGERDEIERDQRVC